MRPPSSFGTPVATVALLTLAALSDAGAQQRAPLDEGLFELFVQRLADRVPLVTLVDSAGGVLVPLHPVLDEVGIPVQDAGDSLVLEWPPDAWRTVVRPGAREVTVGDRTRSFPPSAWVDRDGEQYVATDVLALILAARVDVSWPDLVVMVSGNTEFPAVKRLEREAERSRGRFQSALVDPGRFSSLPYEGGTGGFAAGWGFSMAEAGGQKRGTLTGALGASVLGGGLEVGGTGAFTEGRVAQATDLFGRYSRVFPGSHLVRRVQVGDVLSEGTLARRIEGVVVTNQPFVTPRYFGEAVMTPAVPAGWEYEVYQGEQLVGVSTSDSPSEIRTPLNYGNTPVRIRLLGPAGQEVSEELTYVVPQGRVPPGALRYTLGGGRCQDPGCDSYWFGEALRGFTPWLTAGVGVDRLAAGDTTDVLPFTQLDVSPRPSLNAQIQARGSSFFRTAVQYAAAGRGSLSASYAWTGSDAASLSGQGWAAQASASGPAPLVGGRWVSGNLLMRGLEQGRLDSWQASMATTFRRSHVVLGYESGLQSHDIATLRLFHTLGPRLPAGLDDATLSAALGASALGMELAELGATVRTSGNALLNAQLRLRRGASPVLTLGASIRSAAGWFQARSTRGGGSGTFVGGDGGVAYSPGTGFLAVPTESVGRSGVAGAVFRDLNGNGVRDADEPPETDAVVVVDGRRIHTDERGRFEAWEVTPYEGIAVGVDSLSLGADWAPAGDPVLLRPAPDRFNRVDLPVHRTREVMGSVVTGESDRPVAGVRVEVVDQAGQVVASDHTFSDGVFYFQRVSPGAYLLRVGGTGGTAVEAPFGVPPQEGPPLELPPIRLAPPRPLM
jgi:Carboxypeptidase regulatory-like domain